MGQQDPMTGLGHPQTVVMKLLDGLDGCYRTVVADNFFTSISLAKRLGIIWDARCIIWDASSITWEARGITWDARGVTWGASSVTCDASSITCYTTGILGDAYSIPGDATSIPCDATGITGDATGITGDATSIPGDATSIPGDTTSIPGDTTSIPVDATSIPVDATSIPVDATSIPVDATSIPVDATSIPEVGELWNSFTIPHFNIFYQRRTNSKGGVVVAVGKHLKATRIDIKTENTVIVDIDGLTEPVRVIGVYWPHCQNRNLDELSPFITGKTVLAMWPTVALSCNYCHCNALFCAIMRYNGNNYMIMQQSATWIAGDFNASVYE
ncbi:unnamed protein product [Rotaria sp. Silwood1]|nr:unnamed protein product [Rotaria sp. Silwood1]